MTFVPLSELLVASVCFVGAHFLLSHVPVRDALVGRVGERGFLGVYSLVALVTLVWMIRAYGDAPMRFVWMPGQWLRLVAFVVMPLALVLVAAGLLSRNPTAVMQEQVLDSDAFGGILAVTRHPMMWGVALWASAHVLANGDVASLIFFGALAVLALGGAAHIDARRRRTHGEAYARFAAVTSFAPFVALAAGRARRSGGVRLWVAAALGLIAYVALVMLHGRLFGAPLVELA